ncbi:alpha/beta hydrolase family protein [Dyadobacter tibetensis]|uniref:alpha/beta hydrolase family protein n=1 Tax=Dyadobacter tibetensis TaxID=1211851 RepID=UPI00046F65EA|nr:prolyl oligopeptidase family serine peptidase [Dyadobacter tibetensis]
MRTILTLVFCTICILPLPSLAQVNELCQGAYFTEQEGEDFLKSYSYSTRGEWEMRASLIKERILEGLELKDLPPAPLSPPVIHGKRVMEGYSIEKVFIQTLPGIYMTGNLYRPLKQSKSYAAVLAPHGHGQNPTGRFMEQTQKRCAALARMGAIVFAWDMVGHGDSQQCDHKIAKVAKLQTINSIRALDFLSSLPYVDRTRLAITGESGGGTQTFILTAIDPRIRVSVPCVMVSSYFFGGCACESGMPIHKKGEYQTNNVQIAALAAPRPMLLISDGGDWTRHTARLEYPYIRQIYSLYNQPGQVSNVHLPDEKHDYGPNKREAMYRFMAKELRLDLKAILNSKGKIDESNIPVLSPKELSVYNDQFPQPGNARQGDDAVLEVL